MFFFSSVVVCSGSSRFFVFSVFCVIGPCASLEYSRGHRDCCSPRTQRHTPGWESGTENIRLGKLQESEAELPEQSAQGNTATAGQIVRKFAGDRVDVIAAISSAMPLAVNPGAADRQGLKLSETLLKQAAEVIK